MKPMPKWLLIPPAVALLMVLGPLSMQGDATANAASKTSRAQQPEAEPTPTTGANRNAQKPLLTPRSPDLLQMGSALIGVLLLGVVGIMVLRKLRGGATPTRGGTPLATLRQTLRLSGKQALHAIEFDDRILLVGEHERGLVLLDSGKLPERLADEAEVLARHETPTRPEPADEDEGATPRNLLIPRPATPPKHRTPTPPATTTAGRTTPAITDFRNLLQKAGRS